MRTLWLRDDDEFYSTLRASLDKGEQVQILTEIHRFSDLPTKLKEIFELHKYRTGEWLHMTTGAFVPLSRVAVGFNAAPLYVLGGAAVGAAAGGVIANALGAAVGAAIGAGVGVLAAATRKGKFKTEVEIDVKGKLKIKVTPIGDQTQG